MIVLVLAALARAATLAGTVTASPEGTPLDDVTVYAIDEQLQVTSTTTGPDGRWRLDGLAAGLWRIYAVPDGATNRVSRFWPDGQSFCQGQVIELDGSDQRDGLDLALVEGAGLSGRLLSPTGEPVAGATLTAMGAGDSADLQARATTSNADGSFEVLGLDAPAGAEAGDWLLYVSAAGRPRQVAGATGTVYDEADATPWNPPMGDVADAGEIQVRDGIVVTGTVTGPDGPVASASVTVYAGGQITTVETDDDGVYSASGLPTGQVLSWVSAPGLTLTYYPDADRPETFLSADADGEVVIADLAPIDEATLPIRLFHPDGSPIAGVTVMLYNDTHTVGRGARSDDEGRVTFDGLYGADYELYVYGGAAGSVDDWVRDDAGARRTFTVEGETANPEVEMVLPDAAMVTGTVTDDQGRPVEGATVLLSRPSWWFEADDGLATATTDEDGSWQVGGLGGDAWTVEATYTPTCPDDPSYAPSWWPEARSDDFAAPLELTEGEARDGVDLVLPFDGDHDGMADRWETANDLDTTRDDSGEDPDSDGYSNLVEYKLDTDPHDPWDHAGGCAGTRGALVAPWLGLMVAARRRAGGWR